jgi:hypothetical protein
LAICDNPDGDYISHLLDVIEECGWAVSGVEASATDRGWLYTVGLPARYGHPELLIAGSSADEHRVLNSIGAYIRDSGRKISAGEIMRLGDRVYGFAVVSRARRRAGEIGASIETHRVLGITKVEALEVIRMPLLERCDYHLDKALQELVSEGT